MFRTYDFKTLSVPGPETEIRDSLLLRSYKYIRMISEEDA